MKTWKRIGAVFCVMALMLSLAACGNGNKGGGSEDIATILKTAAEKSEAASSMDAVMTMDFEMNLATDGAEQPLNVKTSMDMNYFAKPLKVKIATSPSEMAGQEVPEQTMYLVEEDGTYQIYTQVGDSWSPQEMPAEVSAQYNPQANLQMYMENAASFKSQGSDTIDGVKAEKYAGVIAGDSLEKVINESGVLENFKVMTQGVDMSAMFKDMADLPITIWINEEGYPIRYEMDMKDMFKTMFEAIMETLGEDAEGVKVDVSKAVVTMDISNYNNATNFEIPEAIAAKVPAEDADAATADGEAAKAEDSAKEETSPDEAPSETDNTEENAVG